MTDQEILRSAIQKAEKNGYTPVQVGIIVSHPRMMGKNTLWSYYHRGIIFSHEFAKAFWKDEPCTCIPDRVDNATYHKPSCGIRWHDWKIRLQSMVLEKNPVKYLEKFL